MFTKSDLKNGLTEFLTELKYEEKKENTIKKYRCNISNFLIYLDDDKEVTKDITLDYKQHLIDLKFKTSTINSYIITINKYLKRLEHNELTVKQLKQQRKSSLEEIMSTADYHRVLRFAKKCNRMDIYYIMKILAFTGIRIDELKAFTVENLKSNYIDVSNKGKERKIILRQDLIRELRKYCRDNNIKKGYLFPSSEIKGNMIDKSTIWRNMKKIAGKAKIKKSKIHAHSFRHLFAKQYLKEHPGDIAGLADILGHNDINTTRIYVRTTNAEKREAMEKIKY